MSQQNASSLVSTPERGSSELAEYVPLAPGPTDIDQAVASNSEIKPSSAESAEVKTPSLLTALENYVVNRDPKNKRLTLLKRGILTFVSGSCMWLYIDPSLTYNKEHGDDLAQTILTFIGNTIPSAFVMLNVAQVYLTLLEKKHYLKEKLGPFLDQEKIRAENRDTKIIFVFAFASAAPLAVPVFQTSGSLPLGVQIFKAMIIQADYTFNHTLAVSFPPVLFITKLPFHILASPFELGRRCRLSTPDILKELIAQQKKEDHDALKAKFVRRFTQALQEILASSFKFHSYDPRTAQFKVTFAPEVRQELAKADPLDQHLGPINYADHLPKPVPVKTSPSLLRRGCTKFNWGISQLVRGAGAALMATGVTGFMMSVFNESRDITQSDD